MNIEKEKFIEVCNSSKSMAEASVKLGMHFNTFRKYALKYNCYRPNQPGKGIKKIGHPLYDLKDILDGKVPHFNTFKLKKRLLKENVFENKCDVCGITEWNGSELNMELDHIDGNRTNHKIQNLRMICPNCHAQTDTYRSKNIKNKT